MIVTIGYEAKGTVFHFEEAHDWQTRTDCRRDGGDRRWRAIDLGAALL
jgi:hypothetical protein